MIHFLNSKGQVKAHYISYHFFQNGTEDLTNYVKNGEWELEGIKTKRNSIIYGCCPEPYYDITYTLKLRRQVLYYAMYFIVPCSLIALLAATIFVLPEDCSERITVGMIFIRMTLEENASELILISQRPRISRGRR